MCIGFITGLLSMVPGGLGVRELTWGYVVGISGFSFRIGSVAVNTLSVAFYQFDCQHPDNKSLSNEEERT